MNMEFIILINILYFYKIKISFFLVLYLLLFFYFILKIMIFNYLEVKSSKAASIFHLCLSKIEYISLGGLIDN